MSESMLVAVPSELPGGLDATPSAHFGHCACYTVATVRDGNVVDATVVPNQGHEEGGCAAPVLQLANNGVKALLCGGMGMRPMAAMQQVGMSVYYCAGFLTVREALAAFTAGRLVPFGADQVCKGCGGHH